MVQETELRIGNIVDAGTVVRVAHNKVTIRKDHKIFSCPPIILQPISLAQEILEKIFRKSSDRSDFWSGYGFCIVDDKEGGFSLYKSGNGINNAAFLTSIKFVHQLQNCFFALTGTELEIKM